MPYANMLVQRRAGRVTAYTAGVNEGHGQFPEKYAKFAYDTRFGFCASRSREVLNQAAPDSMLALVIDDNVFVRKVSRPSSAATPTPVCISPMCICLR